MFISLFFLFLLSLAEVPVLGQLHPSKKSEYQRLPSLKEQTQIQDKWTQERISNIPALLAKHGVDAWLVSQREFAEDTVFWSLKSATEFSARHRTTTLFFANTSNDLPNAYTWIDNTPEVWTNVIQTLELHNPETIALNIHSELSFSSGLHAGELMAIKAALGPHWTSRFRSVPMIAIEYIATRVDSQLAWYRKIQETVWAIVSEAFSERAIVPGTSTADELSWWFREKIQSINYTTWFMPSVSVVVPDIEPSNDELESPADAVINYGDLLNVDFGVAALGLHTDTQHLGYILYPGETEDDVPQGFREGLRKSNRLQDIMRDNLKVGLTGNEILRACRKQMEEEGIEGGVFGHPIGDWGDSAGPAIGALNMQEYVPVFGELPMLPNTYYSIELYAEHFVPERNATYKFMVEEELYWVNEARGWEFVWGRQEKFHLVKTAEQTAKPDVEDKELLIRIQV